MTDVDVDGLLGTAVTLGVTLPLTLGILKMTQDNVNSLTRQQTKKSKPMKRMNVLDPTPFFGKQKGWHY